MSKTKNKFSYTYIVTNSDCVPIVDDVTLSKCVDQMADRDIWISGKEYFQNRLTYKQQKSPDEEIYSVSFIGNDKKAYVLHKRVKQKK